MSIELMMPPTISSFVTLFSSCPQFFPVSRVSFNESALCIRWLKYQSLSFSISLSKKYLGLISFRIDWFVLLSVQGTLKSLIKHNSKASIGGRSQDGGGIGREITFSSTNSSKEQQNGEQSLQNNFWWLAADIRRPEKQPIVFEGR